MNKQERLRAALAGRAVDRVPYSFWTHYPDVDLDPAGLADVSARLCEELDLDFLKAMPNGLYGVQAWGGECDFSDVAKGGVGRVLRAPVQTTADWRRLPRLDVSEGVLGRELRHLELLVQALGPDTPVIATVFSPLTTASKLAAGQHIAHAAAAPAELHAGLETICQVTEDLTRAAIRIGCAGVFLAAQDAVPSHFSAADYRGFGTPYDQRVLDVACEAGGWLNVLHMHGERVHFSDLSRYEGAALNWHIGETEPAIAEYRRQGSKAIVGGLQRAHLTRSDREAIRADVASAMAQTGGRGLILTPACVIRHPVSMPTLHWTADLIRHWFGTDARVAAG